MSPKLPPLTAKEIVKLVKGQRFDFVSQKGSHAKYTHPDGRSIIVPMHAGETLGPGLLLKILSDIGLDSAAIREPEKY